MLQVDCNHSNFDLPQGWARVALGEISEINPRFEYRGATEDLEVTFVPMKCVREMSGILDTSITKKLSEVKKGYTNFRDGDVLFAKITPCMENGKVAIARNLRNGIGFGSTEFHVIRLHPRLPPDFLFHYLLQEGFRQEAQRSMTGTAGQLRVSTNFMRETRVPIPPLAEQGRIVTKIEELFSRLDAGLSSLAKAQVLLKRSRKSVLKSAFEGTHVNRKFAEVDQNRDFDKHPAFPSDWKETTFDELKASSKGALVAGPFGSNIGKRFFVDRGVPVIRGKNLTKATKQFIDEGFVFLTEEKAAEFRYCETLPDDLVITAAGTVGQIGVIPKKPKYPKYIISNKQIRLRLNKELVLPLFIYYWYSSPFIQALLQKRKGGSTIPVINLGIVKRLPAPLPSLQEQQQIIKKIERQLLSIEQLEAVLTSIKNKAEALRTKVLRRAFEGRLVPQNPNDEPALEILKVVAANESQIKVKRNGSKVTASKQTSLGNYGK